MMSAQILEMTLQARRSLPGYDEQGHPPESEMFAGHRNRGDYHPRSIARTPRIPENVSKPVRVLVDPL